LALTGYGACEPGSSTSPEPAQEEPGEATATDATANPMPTASAEAAPDPATPRERPEAGEVHGLPEALAAAAAGNPEGAIKFLENSLKQDPSSLESSLALASALWQVGEYERSIEVQTRSLTLSADPSAQSDMHLTLALRHATLGQADEADKAIDAADKLTPSRIEVKGMRMHVWTRTGRSDTPKAKAMMESLYDDYDASAADTPAELLAVARAAIARGSGGAFQDANMVLSDAEELEPASKATALADELLFLHATIFMEKYASGEAADTLSMILTRDSWNPQALAQLSAVYLKQLALADAQRSAREALMVNPREPTAHATLARIDLIEGRRDEARKRLRESVFVVNPHHTDGLAAAAALAIFDDDEGAYGQARDAALAWHAQGWRFFTSLSDLLGFLHLYPESDQILGEAKKLAPDNPYILSAFGLNRLRLADEKEGRAAIDLAWKSDRYNERTLNTRKLYRDRIEPHYVDYAQGKLNLRVPKEGSEAILPELYEEIARARQTLDHHYGIDPGITRFEIYDTPDDFGIRTVGVPQLGAVGVCFGPTITAIGPYFASHNFYMVAWHELAHVYAITISRGRVPRWFTEGLSEWEASVADPSWTRRSTALLKEARAQGRLRRLSELELAFLRAGSSAMMEVAYMTAAYAMRYLGETYGRAKIIAVLRGYGEGKATPELFAEHLGKTLPQIEKDFDRWFHAELDRSISGWSPSAERGETDGLNMRFADALEQAQRGDFSEAGRSLQAMIEDGGDGFETRMTLARVLMQGPGRASAKPHLEKAATFNLESPDPASLLAKLARESDQPKDELKQLNRVLDLDAVNFESTRDLMAIAMAHGDKASLERGARRCRAIAPLHPACLAATAHASAKRDKRRAKALLDQAAAAMTKTAIDAPTAAILSMTAKLLGQSGRAGEWAKQAKSGEGLSPAVERRL
jgi:tetratricopeptide (TPR) repeat protein